MFAFHKIHLRSTKAEWNIAKIIYFIFNVFAISRLHFESMSMNRRSFTSQTQWTELYSGKLIQIQFDWDIEKGENCWDEVMKTGKIYSKPMPLWNYHRRMGLVCWPTLVLTAFRSLILQNIIICKRAFGIVRDIASTQPDFNAMLLYFNCSVIACNRSMIWSLLFDTTCFLFHHLV